MDDLILILGGVRSGKSNMAQRIATSRAAAGGHPILFLATGVAIDGEMKRRIARHRDQRPTEWIVAEEPLAPARAVSALSLRHVIILDDLGCLITNHLLEIGDDGLADGEDPAGEEVGLLLDAVIRGNHQLVVVSNEVGMGVVPPTPLGRLFRDQIGFANQHLARQASLVILMVAGIPSILRGGVDLGGDGCG